MNDPVLEENPNPGSRRKMQVNPPVFYVSAALIIAFALYGALSPRHAGNLFDALQAAIVRDFGWFYISAVAVFLFLSFFDAEPIWRRAAWA